MRAQFVIYTRVTTLHLFYMKNRQLRLFSGLKLRSLHNVQYNIC